MTRFAFEDFSAGQHIDMGTVVVDRDEMLEFNRRFDPQPFHVDEVAARESLLGGLCASGWYTCSLFMRAYVDTVLADSTSQGSPGGRELRWLAPVFPGDELHFATDILATRVSSSRPGLGLVEITGTASRAGSPVLTLTFTGFFGTRSPSSR
ncbi:MaoC family dehydratase [Nakamurella endophytica]|uniref:Enoyl-CoA hydratase n=1 Tax=Nakamurella endophytica TaxID=1748367 RepID=A0A917SYS4_9ACTN|nr:MaoC family dehydratase [Nakamurella endophytica]GGM01736.1 enoyl-CoA hydratase [Nakamurella endophytica]